LQPNGLGGRICFIVNGIPSDKKFLNTTGLTQQLMKTLQKQISLFGEEELTSSRVDFLVNRTALPGSDSERKTSATCGPKCLESFGRFNHVGLWAKTFSALLIGTGDWYSTRCKLTWKVKGTKYNRLYFQLQASAIAPTKGTGFGLLPTPRAQEIENSKQRIKENRIDSITTMAKLGMLPTPTMYDYNSARHPELWEKDKKKYAEKGINLQCGLKQMNVLGLLPTPIASDIHHAERVQKLKESGAETMASRKNGASRPNGLMDYLDFNQMLPTPTLQDARIGPNNIGGSQHRAERGSVALADIALGLLPTPKVGGKEGYETREKRQGHDKAISHLEAFVEYQTGTPSQQLNPQFVLEMMGFPPNWTELPFLNGETNQSRPGETQSCPK
jgi:hypothetical protein